MARHILPRTQFLHSNGGTRKTFARCSQWLDLPPEIKGESSNGVSCSRQPWTQPHTNSIRFFTPSPKRTRFSSCSFQCIRVLSMPKMLFLGSKEFWQWKSWSLHSLEASCTAHPAGGFKRIDRIVIDDPHWTYRVCLYPVGSYTFTLRNKWTEEETGSDFDALLKHSISESSPTPSSNVIEQIQLWPLQVGWVDYDTEIAASSHLASLRKLIVFPKHCPTTFLDKSLAYVRFYSWKYMRVIVSLLKDSHEGIGQILVSEYVL